MARPGFLICLAAAGDALVRSTRMEATTAYEAGQSFGWSLGIGLVVLALLGGGLFFIVAMIKAGKRRTRGWIIAAIVSGLVALGGLLGATGMLANSLGDAMKSSKEAADRKKPRGPEVSR
jgi:hypothetical protein